jgi:hypothetical protein
LRNRQSNAEAATTSIALSTPNPTSATLPATTPAVIATAASTTFQVTVNHSRSTPRR